MSFSPPFLIGQMVTNTDIVASFGCGNMGGMRRSHKTNTLVIISDHTKGLYEDIWYGDVLHYTGMGKVGDQNLESAQNKTLFESNSNGVSVHLFEAHTTNEYCYKGRVELIDEPYQESQPDDNGNPRLVWMFPIKVLDGPNIIDESIIREYGKRQQKKASELSDEKIKLRAIQNQSHNTSSRKAISTSYNRDPYVAEYTKRRAKGICQLCGEPAPFTDKNNRPYLEIHHIDWLANGGEDTVQNTTALCPNCHRKMHILNLDHDIQMLSEKAKIKE